MAQDYVAALPYHVPAISSILIQSSFLLLLNIANFLLDQLILCGLVGQVLLGMVCGSPGGKLLDTATEEVIVQLGYLGLVLLVYEGGLSTSFASLKADLTLSTIIAVTGVAIPIGLSFCLKPLVSATLLQSFAAGTALCSTSLGTTLTILSTSGLSKTRLGTVITGAAVLDDIAGLVLVQIVSNLGRSADSIHVETVLRPVFVSFAFVVIVLLSCKYIVGPLARQSKGRKPVIRHISKYLPSDAVTFCVHTTILLILVAGASYAGTSDLFAAWVAGAAINWWDEEFSSGSGREGQHFDEQSDGALEPLDHEAVLWAPTFEGTDDEDSAADLSTAETQWPQEVCETNTPPESHWGFENDNPPSGAAIYEKYYSTVVEKLFKPLFFASIGFAIPITEMFDGNIVWRGIIYSLLMAFAKLVTGLWLVNLDFDLLSFATVPIHLPSNRLWYLEFQDSIFVRSHRDPPPSLATVSSTDAGVQPNYGTIDTNIPEDLDRQDGFSRPASYNSSKPQSLYPASITGLAMIARGEIGFLISSLAESEGIFSEPKAAKADASPVYLVVTWAIVVCTIIGPLAVGALVKRVDRLQRRRETSGGPDPLGVWGLL